MLIFSKRAFLTSLLAVGGVAACRGRPGGFALSPLAAAMRDLERARGGRIGVFAHDLETGKTLSHRADERFAMCSTFKWVLCALVLERVDRGEEQLAREIPILKKEIVSHSPVAKRHGDAALSVERLCQAAIALSDNTAANILLKTVGGPPGFTASLRALGDVSTRLDRIEPDLNAAAPGDPRDTSTPRAMTGLLDKMVFGRFLTHRSQALLRRWMFATENGNRRLLAGVGEGWRLGHKPGTNNTRANNDVGFLLSRTAPSRKAVLVASFSDAPGAVEKEADMAHAKIAAAVLEAFGLSGGDL